MIEDLSVTKGGERLPEAGCALPSSIPRVGGVEQVGAWMSAAEENHLRRLVAWVRCEIGQSPEELVETVNSITAKVGEPSEDGKARLVAAYREAKSIPLYVRAAVKALEKMINKSRR